ncbi:PIG-L family deacetylase [Tessaracoccus sp. MC1627]|uniref:PIG-L family deacetylase n=1 Tax=Tessaracoccus sp. MC1627 TaxID=2760312 RepID=UPI00160303BB|nr:PIG-L family deacetylase [Tessaracoccus sp. MC1627]MBB1513202.1 PIG-L family deacetylase [Tessaracoccus sp. MC1627]MBB1513465.1 PIG-L family deacetylase [Tessaracoccus sp. MC1627]
MRRNSGTSGLRALFVVPHQDDEMLTLGAAIKADVADGFTVDVILVTDGKEDPARTGLTAESLGRIPDQQEFSAARDREFEAGVRQLGGNPILPPLPERQPDGGSTVSGVMELVVRFAMPDATTHLRATSTHDYHSDHRNCGAAVSLLVARGQGTDPRLFISRYKSHLWPRGMTKMGNHGGVTFEDQWPYRLKAPDDGWWGIGYDSAPDWFDYLTTIDGASYWHRPKWRSRIRQFVGPWARKSGLTTVIWRLQRRGRLG